MFRTPKVLLSLLLAFLSLSLAACGSTAGNSGGGGGGSSMSGGADGEPCFPLNQGQGCFIDGSNAQLQMICDETNSKWQKGTACAANEFCTELPDPADPNGYKRLTKCVAKSVGPKDTVSGDVNATDAGGTTDTGGITDTGGAPVPGPWLSCAQKKCGSQWGSCAADPGCKSAASCVDGCAGKSECEQSCVQVSGAGQSALVVLMTCATEMACPKGGTGPKCGNGSCETGENATTCPADCKVAPQCGDGKCESPENEATCPTDCKAVPKCGDGKCESPETSATCPSDCKPKPQCGDGKCESPETSATCPSDCKPKPQCGDGKCESPENSATCPSDCKPKPQCGDGKCEGSETSSSCPKDCGLPGPVCGDGKCEGSETPANCSKDCQSTTKTCQGKCGKEGTGGCYCDAGCKKYKDCCPDYDQLCGGGSNPVCGDGKCESGENSSTCPVDCGGSTGGMAACLASKCGTETNACMNHSGCKGVLLFLLVSDCAQTNKCSGASQQTCLESNCASELKACQGDQSCISFNNCLSKCKTGDTNCQGQCMSVGGTPYNNMGQCGQTAGCFK